MVEVGFDAGRGVGEGDAIVQYIVRGLDVERFLDFGVWRGE